MLCHQHLVLAPQRDFFVLNLQIRQIFTRSSTVWWRPRLLRKMHCTQSSHSNYPKRNFAPAGSFAKHTSASINEFVSVSKMSQIFNYSSTSKNVSTGLPICQILSILIQRILHLLRFDHACLELGSTSGACLHNEVSKKNEGNVCRFKKFT